MKLLKTLLCSLLLTTACVLPPRPPQPPQPPVQTDRAVAVFVYDQDYRPLEGAACALQTRATEWVDAPPSNGDGYVVWARISAFLSDTTLRCHRDGYDPFEEHRQLETAGDEYLDHVVMRAQHVDPSQFSLQQLAAIRGSMWTARINVPYGPRPNQDSNILAMVFYELYDTPTRARMLADYRARGYTHAVTGPVTGNDCYHSLYPCRQGIPTQAQWDAYLDTLQEWWDAGIVPIYFHKPDGWERSEHASELAQLDALAAQPRAQRLLRVVIYPGWEPSGEKYGWNNDLYVRMLQRGERVFPNALRGLHTVSDLDAPTGLNDDQVFPPGQGNAISWQRAVPYIHFWADQWGGYVSGSTEVPSQTFLDEACKHTLRVRAGFHDGYAGWPTGSAWGPTTPLRHIAAEYAAFADFWQNWAERYSLQIGDWAMHCGADGYLDGGTVAVR